MCFSAPASFIAAGLTGAVGVACLVKTKSPRDWPLAAMPILFAAQQAIEGLLWQTLPVDPLAAQASRLTIVFLIFAKVFWPVYVPLTALLIEPDARRRDLMRVILLGGVVIAVYFGRSILGGNHEAAIVGGHIAYGAQVDLPLSIAVMYMLATCAAPMMSSHAAVRVMAAIVTAGSAITYAFYWQAFTSVWCFFAAAASAVIYRHFAEATRTAAVGAE